MYRYIFILFLSLMMLAGCQGQDSMSPSQTDTASTTYPREGGSLTYLDTPIAMENLGFFAAQEEIDYTPGTYSEHTGSYMYVADIVMSGSDKTGRLFFIELYGMMASPVALYFVEAGGEYYFLPSLSYGIVGADGKTATPEEKRAFVETRVKKSDIHYNREDIFLPLLGEDFVLPELLTFSSGGNPYTLSFVERVQTPFSEKNLRRLDTLSRELEKNAYIEQSGNKEWYSPESQEIEKLWTNPDYEASNREWMEIPETIQRKYNLEKEQMRLFSSDAIYIEMPDHTTAIYTLRVPFEKVENPDEGPMIELLKNDGEVMILKNYSHEESQSCGMSDGTFANIPDGKFRFEEMMILLARIREDKAKWQDKVPGDIPASETIFGYQNSDLMSIGTTGSGEELLFFQDRNHPFLRAMYEYAYRYGYDEEVCAVISDSCKNLSYDAFVDALPLWFWRDPFGRIMMFVSYSTMMPSACAAKPVIYLYPEETTDISITLDWKKKSLISIPDYRAGWSVTATPEGQIYSAGKVFPYLFWEDTTRYPKPKSGFVVEQVNLEDFLEEKLTLLGLNTREISDFQEYWLPVMQDSPYYRISFLTNENMDMSAPITITPEPDTIQRVFMDWSGLDAPVDIVEQELEPFTRSGFSVIEWGGKKY